MPSEQELINRHGVARGTVRDAMDLLRAEGLVRTEHGRGSFVRDRPPVRRLAHDRFARAPSRPRPGGLPRRAGSGGPAAGGPGAGDRSRVKAPDEVAVWLQLAIGAEVVIRRRRYLADGEPMELATSYIPWSSPRARRSRRRTPGPAASTRGSRSAGTSSSASRRRSSSRMPTSDEVRALVLRAGRARFPPGARRVRHERAARRGVRHGDGCRSLRAQLRAACALSRAADRLER